MAKVASELGVQGQLLGGIVPTHGPEEPLMPDMCWVTETVLVARHRSMVPDAGALPPQGISLVLATIGNRPDAATICLAAANTERGGRAASNPASTATDRRIGRVVGGTTRRHSVRLHAGDQGCCRTVIQCADGRWHDAPRAGLRSSRCYTPSVCPEERFSSSTGIVLMPAVRFA